MRQLLILLTIVHLQACSKDGSGADDIDLIKYAHDPNLPTTSAIKSVPNKGAYTWKANGFFHKWSTSSSYLSLFTKSPKSGNVREAIYIKIDFPEKLDLNVKYKVHALDYSNLSYNPTKKVLADYTRFIDDGVPLGQFTIDPYKENYFILTKFDTINLTFEGRFNAHFRIPKNNYVGFSEFVSFENGVINAKIRK